MDLEPAPFHADLAGFDGPAAAYWVRAEDGIRLRIGHYPAASGAEPAGTILLCPGRTEFIEKYGLIAQAFATRGYHMVTVDWRGQGLSDRLLDDPMVGHVDVFTDYQHDVAATLRTAEALDLPGRHHLIGHSMGGAIGLRAMMDGLDVASGVFTGPMWGIRISGAVRPAAWAISWSSKRVGLSRLFAPGTSPGSYITSSPFKANTLTTDREMWDRMQAQLRAVPNFQLGGPSMHWLHEALAECRMLARRPSPHQPSLCFVGSNERIVDTARIAERMARWRGGRLDVMEGLEHEVLMEGPEIRARIVEACARLFRDATRALRETG